MKLKDYLTLKKIKTVEFAEMVGYTANYISGICVGRSIPSRKLLKIIEITTKGKVKKEDFINHDLIVVDPNPNDDHK